MTQAITNDAGQVALKVHPPQQLLVQGTPSGGEYVFAIRANIAMSWVNSLDVENVLARKKSKPCCPGSSGRVYQYANADDVRRWENGGGR